MRQSNDWYALVEHVATAPHQLVALNAARSQHANSVMAEDHSANTLASRTTKKHK